MQDWEVRELELLKKENQWFEELPEWLKIIDNSWYYIGIIFLISLFGFALGLIIGFLL